MAPAKRLEKALPFLSHDCSTKGGLFIDLLPLGDLSMQSPESAVKSKNVDHSVCKTHILVTYFKARNSGHDDAS